MSSIAIIGAAGYVGLSYSALLADLRHDVIGVDIDPVRISLLNQGVSPIHEPGLESLVQSGLASGTLRFTTDYVQAVPQSTFVFICVGTPSTASGAADTTAIALAAQAIAQHSRGHTIVVNKSTMPLGSVQFVADILREHAPDGSSFDVVSNPEFLREGSAIEDIYHPDRIVLGADNHRAAEEVAALYTAIEAPLLITEPRSAEMIKYASNAFLATKISFINEVATICDRLGADIFDVARGMALDPRISPRFLQAGVGFGGSCFPKDVRALATMARDSGCDPTLLTAVLDINVRMRTRVVEKLKDHLGTIAGRTIGVLGLAFKPETDDVREAPSVALIRELLAAGANVRATDPVAGAHVASLIPEVSVSLDAYGAAMGADALILVTEWPVYQSLDLDRLANAMRGQVVIDGRNALDPVALESAGLIYEGIGRGSYSLAPVREVTSVVVQPVPTDVVPAAAD